jgi:hypothetical protein
VTNGGTQTADATWQFVVRQAGAEQSVDAVVFPLAPGQTRQSVLRVPFEALAPAKSPPTANAFTDASADLWLERTVEFWRGLLDKAARIEVPCRKATDALRAAHVCQLIANDHGELHAVKASAAVLYPRRRLPAMELEAGLGTRLRRRSIATSTSSDRTADSRLSQAVRRQRAALWCNTRGSGRSAVAGAGLSPPARAAEWTRKHAADPGGSACAGLLPARRDEEFLWTASIILGTISGPRPARVADAAEQLGRSEEAPGATRRPISGGD